jgi:hypothetical protein
VVDRPNRAPSITAPPAGEVDFGTLYAVDDWQLVVDGFEIHPNPLQGDIGVGVGPASGYLTPVP